MPLPLPLTRARAVALAVALLVVLALALRVWRLATLPAGLHGDEAFWGLLARQVLDEGWIGPYTPRVAGAPTGPVYLMAPAIALLGQTMLAVRIVPALAGAFGVLALVLVARRELGDRVALVAGLLLATLAWHLHFSRLGFPLIWWPLVTLLAAWTAVRAAEGGGWRWWAACGGLLALGIYGYNAQPSYAAIVGLFLLLAVARRRAWRAGLRGALVATLAGVVVLLPMLDYALDPANDYVKHFRQSSLTQQPAWQERDSLGGKLSLIAERYGDHWQHLLAPSRIDPVDGTGKVALAPRLFVYLAAVGLVLALAQRRRRQPLLLLGALIVLLLPLSAVLTEGGMVRRSFAAAPFLALFAAVTVDELLRIAGLRAGWRRPAGTTLAALVVLATVAGSLHLYYVRFADDDVQRVVLANEMTAATRFMLTLPDDAEVLFLSDRWSFDYTIREYLAPDVQGEDRSRRFGSYSLAIAPSDRRTVFILLDAYRRDLADLQLRYPGGRTTIGGPADNPTFIAYEPPR